jgi:hypothetical protein
MADDERDVKAIMARHGEKFDALIGKLGDVLPLSPVVGSGPFRDIWLCRYLLGFKMDPALAAEKFRQMVSFRLRHRMDEVREQMENGLKPHDFPGFVEYQGAVHSSYDLCSGRARDGSPIEIERTPQFDFEKIVALDPAVADRYIMYCLEYHFHLLDTISRDSGRLAGYVKIMDLSGIKLGQLPWIRRWQQNSASRKERLGCEIMECYPECFSKVAVVNAPSFFSMIWKLVKPFIPPRTADKVSYEEEDTYLFFCSMIWSW